MAKLLVPKKIILKCYSGALIKMEIRKMEVNIAVW